VARLVAPVVVGTVGGLLATIVQNEFESAPCFMWAMIPSRDYSTEQLASGLGFGLLGPPCVFWLWDVLRRPAEGAARTLLDRIVLGAAAALVTAVLVAHLLADVSITEPGIMGWLPFWARVAGGVGFVVFALLELRWAQAAQPVSRGERAFTCFCMAVATHVIACSMAGLHPGRPVPFSWPWE
jgi:hypothetical protein